MSNPKNPSGGPNTDDFDALLESLGEEKPAAAPPSPPKPSGPPRKTPVQMYVPLRPAAPPPRLAEPSSLSSLFDDDEVEMPTRMVDAGEIKRQAGVLAPAAPSGSAGLGDLFAPEKRPTAPPPADVDLAATELELEEGDRPSGVEPSALPGLSEGDLFADLALSEEEVTVKPSVPSPLPRTVPPPSLEEQLELGGESLEIALDGEDLPALDLTAGPADEAPEPPLPAGAGEEGFALEAMGDEGSALEGEGVSLEAGEEGVALGEGEEGPEFVTESEEETIDLEVGGEEELAIETRPSDADRGALLAATVTSRRRWLEPAEVAFAGDARAEVEARVGLLEGEAEHAEAPERAAEMLAIAGELVEGVLGDRARARVLFERANELAPASPFVVRALRRLAIADGDVARASELCDVELGMDLGDEERAQLELLAAELGAREGAAVAEARWERIAQGGGARGALAQLFIGGSRHDPAAMGEALGTLGQTATGSLAAAASLARARLAEGAAEADTAFAAVQAAVQRDPSDVGSWLAMARLAFGRESAGAFREALAGIAHAGAESAAGGAALALDRALAGVLSDAVTPAVVPSAGPEGWLVAHALRDAGLDETPQVEAALAVASEAQRPAWAALGRAGGEAAGSEVARLFALRRAARGGDVAALATAAAALVGEDAAARAGLSAAILARKGEVTPAEVEALDLGTAMRRPELSGALVSAIAGVDEAETRVPPAEEGAFARLAGIIRAARNGGDVEVLRTELEALAQGDAPLGVRVFAAREAARLEGGLAATARVLRFESELVDDGARVAALRFLGAAAGAGLGADGVARDALEAARSLPGELAAAEVVALFGARGELPPGDVAEVLSAAAGDASSTALRMAAVRAALRRGAVEPEAASDALYDVWSQARGDGALAALVLRALPPGDGERRAVVLRELAERAQGAGAVSAVGAWTLLAQALSDAGKPAEAAQALARARSHALTDPALLAWEESLWLRAGMFAEIAERSFDALKSAQTDEARIAAYEKLAEVDSTFRQDVASAVLTYQAILELAPGHMASLRTLERYFLEQSRYDELLGIYDRLIRHVADPEDATAIAHAAARIAIKQAEGDPSAGVPFWAAAFERGAADLRTALALEAEARRAGDARRFLEASMRAEVLVTDPREQAAFATRAGEAQLSLGDVGAAIAAFERAVAAWPTQQAALTWLAFAREAYGDVPQAAEALEALGRACKVPAQGAAAFLRAAVLWQDQVQDAARARAALQEVLARDPVNAEAFQRSTRVLSAQGDQQAELALLEGRIEAGGEAAEILPLHVRAAEVAEQIGDPARARGHLKAALAIDPDLQDALRALARLARGAAEWSVAADAMIRLARLTTDPAERVELMFTLGEIFDRHLDDPKRAESAYKRVLQLQAGDARALARLADLYARTNDGANEAEVLRGLIQVTEPGPARRALQIRLGVVLSERLNEGKKAEEVLEAARREAPTDLDVLRAFARLYVREQSPQALAVLLDRAAAEVRRTLDANPADPASLELLADILKLRGRVDGARVVSAVAYSLGVQSEKLAGLSREGVVPGAGAGAFAQEVLELLAPPAISGAHRELFRLAGDVLEKLMPFQPGALRAEKLGARLHPLRAEVEKWARVFGFESVEMYLGPATPLVVTPIGRHPAAVMLPVDLKDSPVARFVVVRAMTLVALSMPLLVRLSPRESTLMMTALLRQFEPMYSAEGVDPAQLDELSRRMVRTFPRPRHAEMAPHGYEVAARKGADGETLAAGAIELANRLAVLASGDIAGAVRALTPAGVDAKTAANTVPAVARIVRVALSDRFLEARHIAGVDRRGSQS